MSLVTVDVSENKTTLIADTQLTRNAEICNVPGFKTIVTKSAIIGLAGTSDFRHFISQVFNEFPLPDDSDESLLYVIEQLQAVLGLHGLTYSDNEHNYATMLVVTKTKSFIVTGFTLYEVAEFDAIGAPAEAYMALRYANVDNFPSVVNSCVRNIYCSPPFDVIEVDRTGHVYGRLVDDAGAHDADDEWEAWIDFVQPEDEDDEDFPHVDFSHIDVNVIKKDDPASWTIPKVVT